jgi:MFS family permease
MDTKFTEQESLAVISEMIDRARNNVQKGSGTFMIYWGSMVAITALLNIVLVYVLVSLSAPPHLSFNIWWIMAPAWIVSFRLQRKRNQSVIVKSHIDKIISSVWHAFGISNAIFILIIFGFAYSLHEYKHFFYMINPIIILITGIGEFVTAKACRFRPFLYGAIAMWAGSLLSALAAILWSGTGVLVQFGILAICMIIGFIIPGYKLNKLAKESHV